MAALTQIRSMDWRSFDWRWSALPAGVIAAASMWRYVRSCQEFAKIDAIAPSKMELLRHLWQSGGDVGKFLTSLVHENGYKPIKLHFLGGGIRLMLVSSPGIYELTHFPKGKYYAMLNVLFGDNLITLNNPEHHRHRQFLSRGFSFGTLYGFIPAFDRHARSLVDAWEGQGVVEMHEWMTKVTFDIISEMAFGYDPKCVGGCKEGERFAQTCQEVASYVMHHFLHIPGLAQLWKLAHHRQFSFLDRKIYGCITERKAELANRAKQRTPSEDQSTTAASSDSDGTGSQPIGGGGKPRDLLDMMLLSGKFTDREIRDESFIFFLAGHETTAVTLTWILGHVAAKQQLQQRLRDEICSTLGDGPLRRDTEKCLPLVTNTINEGLRMYPPAFAFTRHISKDVTLDGAKVPAGYDAFINLLSLHRHPQIYERPDEFDPHRWEKPEKPDDKLWFSPFSFGNRECIGKNFAWLEAKTILCEILRAYELRLEGSIPDWTTLPISTTPNRPIRVQLKRIKK
jgi:cytochrome P450